MVVVAMRSDCKHYESRTYASGEAVRKCLLDLAPEAPWNCPADCPRYERRKIDAGWQYGSLAKGPESAPSEPEVAMDADIAALLDATEDIVNAAGFELMAKEAKRGAPRKGMFKKNKKKKR
jgi:hypothetical protein